MYLELGDADRAEALLPALDSYGDTVVVLWPGTTVLGPALYRGGVRAAGAARCRRRAATRPGDLRRVRFAPFAGRARRLLAGCT